MPYIEVKPEKSVYVPEEVWRRCQRVAIIMATEPEEVLVIWLSHKLGKDWAEKIQTLRDEDWIKLFERKKKEKLKEEVL